MGFWLVFTGPGGGEFAHQKIGWGFCLAVLPGGWSGLELTDTQVRQFFTIPGLQSLALL